MWFHISFEINKCDTVYMAEMLSPENKYIASLLGARSWHINRLVKLSMLLGNLHHLFPNVTWNSRLDYYMKLQLYNNFIYHYKITEGSGAKHLTLLNILIQWVLQRLSTIGTDNYSYSHIVSNHWPIRIIWGINDHSQFWGLFQCFKYHSLVDWSIYNYLGSNSLYDIECFVFNTCI